MRHSGMLSWDQQLFRFINQSLANPVMDWLMPWITDLHKNLFFLGFLLPLGLIFWVYKEKKQMILPFFTLILMVATLDNFNHRIVKPTFDRKRPPLIEETITLRSPHHGGLSFPSNHAANVAAGATFLSLCYTSLAWPFGIFAFLVALSRVYVGVHYPLDVIAGAFLGLIFGFAFFRVHRLLKLKFQKTSGA